MIVICAEGTAGGKVPYFRIPSVGVAVGLPEEIGCVAVFDAMGLLTVPLVAVAGVVVRFGMGDEEGVSVTTVVGNNSTTGVTVSVAGTIVGEG